MKSYRFLQLYTMLDLKLDFIYNEIGEELKEELYENTIQR